MALKKYRVAASCFEPDLTQTVDSRRQALGLHITELLKEQTPDLLVLPEVVIVPDSEKHASCGSESISGPTVKMVSQIASDFSVNICIPIIEVDDGILYNTAVYVNRGGKIAGKYRKIVPTTGEVKKGIRPGNVAQKPIDLDGIRIGTAICFDQNFPDLIWNYINSGVDLLVFPSYTYAGHLMQSWAFNCGVPLVCAFPWESVIYDRDGSILAKAGTETSTVRFDFHPRWIACSLNFQSRIYHLDENQNKLKDIMTRYGNKIDIRLMVWDARMMITVVSEEIDIDQIEKAFGLLPLQEYLRESRASSGNNIL
ncbi:MAG: carbon-nitrogen hydrolase family protein [Sedimentisphaerales bacterium]